MSIILRDGPLDGRTVSRDLFSGEEAVVVVAEKTSVCTLQILDGAPYIPTPQRQRKAVYRLDRDNDSGTSAARFVFWDDERPVDVAMQSALSNASDDDILKLIDDMEKQRRGGKP